MDMTEMLYPSFLYRHFSAIGFRKETDDENPWT